MAIVTGIFFISPPGRRKKKKKEEKLYEDKWTNLDLFAEIHQDSKFTYVYKELEGYEGWHYFAETEQTIV